MAVPPISAPVSLDAAVLERCVRDLAAPTAWSAIRADAVEREGHVTIELLLSGPLAGHPDMRFEIPLPVTLDANQAAPTDAREDLSRAIAQCQRAAESPALAAWAEGLTDCVARLDAIGDAPRLLCRGLRDGIAAGPLWI